jgi:hypothetical protein
MSSPFPASRRVLHFHDDVFHLWESQDEKSFRRDLFRRSDFPLRNPKGSWSMDKKKGWMGPTRILHDFRRTAVRNMVRSGIPERAAMEVSGHKTRSVFDRYHIVSQEDLKEAARRQQAYLKSQDVTADGYILEQTQDFRNGAGFV